MRRLFILAACAALCGGSAQASTVSIDFDTGSDSTLVGNFYAGQGVTFANAEFAGNFGLPGTSGGLGVRAPGTFTFGPANAVTGTFASTVTSVSVRGIDVGGAGIRLSVFDAANNLLGSSTFIGSGIGVGVFQDLTTSFAGIKSFAFSQDAECCGDGVLFDNFSFTTGVPEAQTWIMMIAGFGLVGAASRRRAALAA